MMSRPVRYLLILIFGTSFFFVFARIWSRGLQAWTPDYDAAIAKKLEEQVAIAQDDLYFVRYILHHHVEPPSPLVYNLSDPAKHDPSMGQAAAVDELLKHKTGGFFVECGALDGETRSNTLYFERSRGWEGVLIEGDPNNFKLMTYKHRKAFTIQACLSTEPYPVKVDFVQHFNLGHISETNSASEPPPLNSVPVQCFPLASILFALNRTRVDYFSLDVEGSELKVLRTIPWDKVDIRVLSVEFRHVPEGKQVMKEYMAKQGYLVAKEVTHVNDLANDFIFVKSES